MNDVRRKEELKIKMEALKRHIEDLKLENDGLRSSQGTSNNEGHFVSLQFKLR